MPKRKNTPIKRSSQTTANSGFSVLSTGTQGIQKSKGHRGVNTTAVKGQRTCCGG